MRAPPPVSGVPGGPTPAVIEGKDGVLAFYNSVGEAVLWHSDDRIAVGDWGVADEITFHQLARGGDLRAIGYDVPDPEKLYHVSSRQAFIWPYDDQALLAGEHLYEDKTGLQGGGGDPSEAIPPARGREIHREQLGKLEAERGDRFWVLGNACPSPWPAGRPARVSASDQRSLPRVDGVRSAKAASRSPRSPY